jgi:hypothetical protein
LRTRPVNRALESRLRFPRRGAFVKGNSVPRNLIGILIAIILIIIVLKLLGMF